MTTCVVAASERRGAFLRVLDFAAACFDAVFLAPVFSPLFERSTRAGFFSDFAGPRALDVFAACAAPSTFAVTSSVHRTPRPVRAAGTLIAFFGTVESPIVSAAGQLMYRPDSRANRKAEGTAAYKTVASDRKRGLTRERRRCATAQSDTERRCAIACQSCRSRVREGTEISETRSSPRRIGGKRRRTETSSWSAATPPLPHSRVSVG